MEQKKEQTIPLNKIGCRLLAIGVIKSAIRDKDYRFFESDSYDFWAGLAYGCKEKHREGKDIILDIEQNKLDLLDKDLRKENGGRHSKWF